MYYIIDADWTIKHVPGGTYGRVLAACWLLYRCGARHARVYAQIRAPYHI